MKKALIITILTILSFAISFSCKKDSGNGGSSGGGSGGGATVDCSTVSNKAFGTDVDPIIQGRCNIPACHASGSTNGPGPLTNYSQVFNARSAIRTAVASGRMPQGSTLSAAQKNSIICWIDSGAPNN